MYSKKEQQHEEQLVNSHTPLAVPVGRQIDARESHVDAGEVSESGLSRGEVRRLGIGKRLLKV